MILIFNNFCSILLITGILVNFYVITDLFPEGSLDANKRLIVDAYMKKGDSSKYGPIAEWDISEVSEIKLFIC